MSRINLKKLMDEIADDDQKKNALNKEIIRYINDPEVTGYALLFTKESGGGTIGAISSSMREKMAKTALHFVANLAKDVIMEEDDES